MTTPRPSSPFAAELARTETARMRREAQRVPLHLAGQFRVLRDLARAAGNPLRDLRVLTDQTGRPALSAELLGNRVSVQGEHAHLWHGGDWVRVTPRSASRLDVQSNPPPEDSGTPLSVQAATRLRQLAALLGVTAPGRNGRRPALALVNTVAVSLFLIFSNVVGDSPGSGWLGAAANIAPWVIAACVLLGATLIAARPVLIRAVWRELPRPH